MQRCTFLGWLLISFVDRTPDTVSSESSISDPTVKMKDYFIAEGDKIYTDYIYVSQVALVEI